MVVIWFLVFAAFVEVTSGQCERFAAPEVEVLNETRKNGIQSLAGGFLRTIGKRVEPEDYSSIVNETVAGHTTQAIRKIWQVDLKQPRFAACFAVGIVMVIIMPLVGIDLMCHRYCRCCRRRQDSFKTEFGQLFGRKGNLVRPVVEQPAAHVGRSRKGPPPVEEESIDQTQSTTDNQLITNSNPDGRRQSTAMAEYSPEGRATSPVTITKNKTTEFRKVLRNKEHLDGPGVEQQAAPTAESRKGSPPADKDHSADQTQSMSSIRNIDMDSDPDAHWQGTSTSRGPSTTPGTWTEKENRKLSYRLATGLLLCCVFWVICVKFYYDNGAGVWPQISLVRDGILNQIDGTTAYFRSLQEESSCLGDAFEGMVTNDVEHLMQMLPNYTTKSVVPLLPTREMDSFYDFLKDMLATQQEYLQLLKSISDSIPRLEEYPTIFTTIGIREGKCSEFGWDAERLNRHLAKILPSIETANAKLNKTISSRRDLYTEVKNKIEKDVGRKRSSTDARLRKSRQDVRKTVKMIQSRCNRFVRSLQKTRQSVAQAASPEQLQRYIWMKHLINLMILPSLVVLIGILAASGCGGWSYRDSRKGKTRQRRRNLPKGTAILFHATSFATLIFGCVIVSITFLLFFVGYSAETVVCDPLYRSRDLTYLDKITTAAGYSTEEGGLIYNISKILLSCEGNDGIADAFDDIIPTYRVPEVRISRGNFMGDVDKSINKLKETESSEKESRQLRDFGAIVGRVADTIVACRNLADEKIRDPETRLRLKKKLSYPDIASELRKADEASYDVQRSISEMTSKASGLSATLANLKNASTKAKMDNIMNDVKTIITSTLNNTQGKALQMFMNMGRCRALYNVYKNMGELICGQIVDSVNGMWFSMGMQLLALIPTVVFSLLLSTHFLAMSAERSRMLEAENP